jgi:hypothetical protein
LEQTQLKTGDFNVTKYLQKFHNDFEKHGIKGVGNSLAKSSEKPTTAGSHRPSKSNVLSTNDTINWLKKRHRGTAQAQYLKTRQEIQQDEEIQEVFTKIDYDKSGKIDIGELHQMFQSNGIEMTREEIEIFFELCKSNCRGYLDFSEFKQLY